MRRDLKIVLAGAAALALTAAAAVAPNPATAATAAPAAATDAAPDGTGSSKGPVGWDIYRHLDQLPSVPVGVQTKQFSSFDRAGGNADFLHTLRRTDSGGYVLAERNGPGEVDSIWTTSDGGDVTQTGNIHVVLDGRTVLDAPEQDVVDGKLGAPFVFPLVANASQSSGGAYIAVPMPYRQSMLIWTDHDPIYYHVTYRSFPDAVGVQTFDPTDKASDVIAELRAAGTADPKPAQSGATTTTRELTLPPGASTTLADVHGPGELAALRLHLPQLVAPPKPTYVTDDGRAFGGDGSYSQFTATIDPANDGVRLTRRLDAGIGHQAADIYVDGQKVASWAPLPPAGGCNWVDQTVDLPASATAGKSQITVRNLFTSSDLDFNEFSYFVDSHVNGSYTRTDTVDVGPQHTSNEATHDYSINKQTWEGVRTFCYPPSVGDPGALTASNDILANLRLRISFDGTQTVDAPVGEFYGIGLGLRDVRALMYGVDANTDWLSAWWPMPYRAGATVTLYNGSQQTVTAGSAITSAPDAAAVAELGPNGLAGYFRADSHLGHTTPGQDHVFLKASGTGKFVGVNTSMRGDAGYGRGYLEGDERVYYDGARTPQIHGTGSEDFYEGGWYFDNGTFSDPFNGNTAQEGGGEIGCATDCVAAYRLMIADAVPFASSIDFGIEHGGTDDVPATYGSTAFWYGRPQTGLLQSDALDVGDPASEQAHGYRSTDPGAITTLTATYEGNNGTPQPVTGTLRATSAPISFDVNVAANNAGVQLLRTSDQQAAYQAAEVYVDGADVGTWRQPLGNGAHRWLDDFFAIPPAVTAGRSTLSLRLVPLAGAPAWSASRYVVQSLVRPRLDAVPPAQVTGVQAVAVDDSNTIAVSWQPAGDNVGVDHYDVYASPDPDFRPGPDNVVGSTATTSFTLDRLGLQQTWFVRVRAVDAAGNAGPASDPAAATTGSTLRIEAESLLPAVAGTAPAQAQTDCCGISWSGGAQLWVRANAAGQYVTVAFDVPETGTYDLTAVQTQAGDYGVNTLAIDGNRVGPAFDAYHPTVTVAAPIDYGSIPLAAGRHELTVTVTGHNAAASGYLAGVDYLQLHLGG